MMLVRWPTHLQKRLGRLEGRQGLIAIGQDVGPHGARKQICLIWTSTPTVCFIIYWVIGDAEKVGADGKKSGPCGVLIRL
jgi:hypothetical protein